LSPLSNFGGDFAPTQKKEIKVVEKEGTNLIKTQKWNQSTQCTLYTYKCYVGKDVYIIMAQSDVFYMETF